jgi:hypothetical protein
MINFFKGYAWSKWIQGLWAAVVGGGATSASGVFAVVTIDPQDFNFHTIALYKAAVVMFAFGAVTHFFAYLKEHPTPEMDS